MHTEEAVKEGGEACRCCKRTWHWAREINNVGHIPKRKRGVNFSSSSVELSSEPNVSGSEN